MTRFLTFCLWAILLCPITLNAQEKYWIYFNSKTGDSESPSEELVKAQRDLPINNEYLSKLAELSITAEVKSKWLNAITAKLSEEQLEAVKGFDFVDDVRITRRIASATSIEHDDEELIEQYVTVLKQVKAEEFISRGLYGEGVDIGIIDGGFLGADREESLNDMFYEDQFKDYRDFTGSSPEPFEGQKIHKDDHGTRVWNSIGGYERDKDRYLGIATYSNYYLAKSDRGDREFRGEEDYWIAAIEWMDSLGVRIVNSSLGYSTGFDDPVENYDPLQIDGHSAPITQAAQIAAEEKGILIVVSAGNDGNKDFQFVSVPADAKDVFAVGACSTGNPSKISFSSIGSPVLPYIKPDACCYSLGGTSFSAPVITGMAAAMLQYKNGLSNFEIMDLIRKSSHLYPYGNNYVGFGVPDSDKIIRLMDNPEEVVWDAEEKEVTGNLVALLSEGEAEVTVFHKKNDRLVIEEEEIKSESGEFIIAKPAGAKRSTVAIAGKVWEIIWQ